MKSVARSTIAGLASPPATIVTIVAAMIGMLVALPARAVAETPRVAFAGVYGATAGAGRYTAWDRHGSGQPAASGPPGWSAAAAGYAPFGLEDLRVAELSLARDAARWGVAASWRSVSGAAGDPMSRVTGSVYRHLWSGGTVGFGIAGDVGAEGISTGASLGTIWRPARFVTMGGQLEVGAPSSLISSPVRGGIGLDFGTALGGDASWRVAVGRTFDADVASGLNKGLGTGLDYGLSLHLHELLGIHAGFAPGRETASFGLVFGFGGWQGHSALQRHARLGGTSVQGLSWRSTAPHRSGRRP